MPGSFDGCDRQNSNTLFACQSTVPVRCAAMSWQQGKKGGNLVLLTGKTFGRSRCPAIIFHGLPS